MSKTMLSGRREEVNSFSTTRPKDSIFIGGKMPKGRGYVRMQLPNHPYCNCDGYIFEHRVVVEKHMGRYLTPKEKVHHKNGIRNDNRIENLEIVKSTPHYGKIECPYCNKEFLIQ